MKSQKLKEWKRTKSLVYKRIKPQDNTNSMKYHTLDNKIMVINIPISINPISNISYKI